MAKNLGIFTDNFGEWQRNSEFLLANFRILASEVGNSCSNVLRVVENFGILTVNFPNWWRILEFSQAIFENGGEFSNSCWGHFSIL